MHLWRLVELLCLCSRLSSSITTAVHIRSLSPSPLLVRLVTNTSYSHSVHVVPRGRSFIFCLLALLRDHSSWHLFMSEWVTKDWKIHPRRTAAVTRVTAPPQLCTKEIQIYWIIGIGHDTVQLYWPVLQLETCKTNTWHGGLLVRPHDLSSRGRRCRLKTAACAAGLLMISLWSSVLFSQQTAAYCLLLGRIKLCVLVGCCGGGGRAFLCDMGHWLLFHSSGTIMRYFFFFQNISAAIQRSDCVYEIVHTSLNAGAGEGKAIFKTLANCFLLLCRDW